MRKLKKKPGIGEHKCTEIWSEFQGIIKWGKLVSDISTMLKVHYVSPLGLAASWLINLYETMSNSNETLPY